MQSDILNDSPEKFCWGSHVAHIDPNAPTLFDKYGGVPFVTGIVTEFYRRVLFSPELAHYFTKSNTEAIVAHQIRFISVVMGKPSSFYTGRDLVVAHRHLNISNHAFDVFGNLMEETLLSQGIEDEDAKAIMAKVEALRQGLVVSR